MEPSIESLGRSLARWRIILLVIAVGVSGGLHLLFERQARRLDALGAHGVVTQATVTRVSANGSSTFVDYAYEVNGVTYSWNVASADVPEAKEGAMLPIVYVPDDPAMSRTGMDRSRGRTEAASNRSFARKAVGGFFAFFAFNALLCEVRLRRLRKTGLTEVDDPQAYRTRLIVTGLVVGTLIVLIFGWHLSEAARKGESSWAPIVGVVVSIGILVGTGFYVLRHGRMQATTRSERLIRWAAPIAAAAAGLRLIAWLLGWQ